MGYLTVNGERHLMLNKRVFLDTQTPFGKQNVKLDKVCVLIFSEEVAKRRRTYGLSLGWTRRDGERRGPESCIEDSVAVCHQTTVRAVTQAPTRIKHDGTVTLIIATCGYRLSSLIIRTYSFLIYIFVNYNAPIM